MSEETIKLLKKIVDESTSKNGEVDLIKIGGKILWIVRDNSEI